MNRPTSPSDAPQRTPRHRPSLTRVCSVLAGTALAVAVASCSGSDSAEDDTGTSTGTDAASSAQDAPATADTTTVSGGYGNGGSGEIVEPVAVKTEVPGEDPGAHFVERIEYSVRDGDPDPTQNWADFYLPDGTHDEDTVPLVIFVHGGAWHGGAPGVQPIAEKLTERGLAVLNVEYRDISEGGGYPQTFTDVADALDQVPSIDQRHPEITTDDETIVGHSAGAQLAVWAGTRGDLDDFEVGADPKFTPNRVVSLAGPLDLVWAAEHGDQNIVTAMGGTPDELPEQYDSIDPIQNINRRIPVVAMHGLKDNLVPRENSEHYVDAVTRDGGDAKLVLMDNEDHVSFLKDSSPHFDQVLDVIHGVTTKDPDELHDRLDGGTTTLAESGS